MLIAAITESDPIYQFCEACVTRYVETEDESWISLLSEQNQMTDSQMMASMQKVLNPGNSNFEEVPGTFNMVVNDAHARHSVNPFAALGSAMKIGDLPSRAAQIGIHQPQGRYIKTMTFWQHKNAQKAMNALVGGGIGLGALYKLHEYRNKPKTVIAKKIASLRKILAKFKAKVAGSKSEQEKSMLKKICAKIIGAIETLLKFAQKKSDKYLANYD